MLRSWIPCLAVIVISCSTVFAGDGRPFSLVEDAYPEGKGSLEVENTFVYSRRVPTDPGFQGLDVEHEFEFGMSDNFDLKIPIAYHWEESDATDSNIHFDEAAIQADYYFTSPSTDALGIALFNEFSVGESVIGFAQTLVLQKDIGKWVFAYNLAFETEVEGVFHTNTSPEVGGTIINSLGASYSLTNAWRIGAEAAAESGYANWSEYEGTVVRVGPVINYNRDHWWFTVGPNVEITNHDDEPQYQITAIIAFST